MTNPQVPPAVRADDGVGSVSDLARQLQQTILLFERLQKALVEESDAQARRVDAMAKALSEMRDQTVTVLQQAAGLAEVATTLINGLDDQTDKLVETTLALAAIYDQATEGEGGEGEGE